MKKIVKVLMLIGILFMTSGVIDIFFKQNKGYYSVILGTMYVLFCILFSEIQKIKESVNNLSNSRTSELDKIVE